MLSAYQQCLAFNFSLTLVPPLTDGFPRMPCQACGAGREARRAADESRTPLCLGFLPREGAQCATGGHLVCTPVEAPPTSTASAGDFRPCASERFCLLALGLGCGR